MYKENTTEYVTVNENQDLWIINYTQGIANYCESQTLDDLAVNNKEYEEIELDSVGSYLEEKGYIINEDESTELRIVFVDSKKVSA